PVGLDSVYGIDVEGVPAVRGTPSASTRWFAATVTVSVTDGRLTITNAAGSRNNKIDFVTVTGGAPAGLVGAYRFNEGSGTATRDGSGSMNNGTLAGGVRWAAGHAGSGLAFDGLTGRVELLTDLSPWLGASGTVAFWART